MSHLQLLEHVGEAGAEDRVLVSPAPPRDEHEVRGQQRGHLYSAYSTKHQRGDLHNTIQYSTVQYSTVQYCSGATSAGAGRHTGAAVEVRVTARSSLATARSLLSLKT